MLKLYSLVNARKVRRARKVGRGWLRCENGWTGLVALRERLDGASCVARTVGRG